MLNTNTAFPNLISSFTQFNKKIIKALKNEKELKDYLNTAGCMHRSCTNCNGTGQGLTGTCIHMISCSCWSCSPWC